MDSIKIPKLSGERRYFDVWKKRFRAFGMMRTWAPALSSYGAASSQQQVDIYSTLILALPENDLSIIENVSQDDKTYSHTAWTALVNHYEDDGIYRCTELLQDKETPYGRGGARIFAVVAMAVVRRVMVGPSARTSTPEVTLRRWTPRLLFRRSWT
jgi:hypothetical protein